MNNDLNPGQKFVKNRTYSNYILNYPRYIFKYIN